MEPDTNTLFRLKVHRASVLRLEICPWTLKDRTKKLHKKEGFFLSCGHLHQVDQAHSGLNDGILGLGNFNKLLWVSRNKNNNLCE